MLSCTALCRYAKATPKQESILEGTEDPVPSASTSSIALTEEEQEELRKELAKVEDEVRTLSQVLSLKEKRLGEIKKKLGITPFGELKQSLTRSWQQVQEDIRDSDPGGAEGHSSTLHCRRNHEQKAGGGQEFSYIQVLWGRSGELKDKDESSDIPTDS
ncbi:tumor protein D52-like isoform X3 [Megalops cyprinoides]|uniref:tumor protein D52-like isoform X3 n=1 Tax=Megalops cyprinoides TaxID=118141 RepID=UPI001864F925|nr:tumor protein D52-like isoform X3 [Megalops cyprinoides]